MTFGRTGTKWLDRHYDFKSECIVSVHMIITFWPASSSSPSYVWWGTMVLLRCRRMWGPSYTEHFCFEDFIYWKSFIVNPRVGSIVCAYCLCPDMSRRNLKCTDCNAGPVRWQHSLLVRHRSRLLHHNIGMTLSNRDNFRLHMPWKGLALPFH